MPKHTAPIAQAMRLTTPLGQLEYTLMRKKVRNINLRVRADNSVVLSASPRVPQKDIDTFLCAKHSWILRVQSKAKQLPISPPLYSKDECFKHFTALSNAVFPLFAGYLGEQKPTIKIRQMKTRWAVCNPTARSITFNSRLAEKPLEAQEYVVMHEYVHFLHPHHQASFHAEMARLMPDYLQRRKLLR